MLLLVFCLFYSVFIQPTISFPPKSLHMIYDSPQWWLFLTYDITKSHINVTKGLKCLPEDRIKFVKEGDGASTCNQLYDKFQAKQYKLVTIQLLYMAQCKVCISINQWQLIIIVSTVIQNISAKVWKY